jgi:WD40 repeat protein
MVVALFAFILAGVDCIGAGSGRVTATPMPGHPTGKSVLLADLKVGTTTRAISFSPSGELISAGNTQENEKYVVTCWELDREKLRTKLKTDFETFVSFVDVSPNGETILAADNDGNVNVFSRDGRRITTYKMFERGGAYGGVVNTILDVKFVNDQEVLTVALENVASLRNVSTNVSKLYYLRSKSPDCAAFASFSGTLAWADEFSVFVWKGMLRAKARPCEIRVREKLDNYRMLACSDDGSAVAFAYGDSEIRLVDVNSGKIAKAWNGHKRQTLNILTALRKNDGFVSACADQVKIWRQNGDLVTTLQIDFDGIDDEEVSCVACNRDSTVLAVGTRQKILVYDLKRILNAREQK